MEGPPYRRNRGNSAASSVALRIDPCLRMYGRALRLPFPTLITKSEELRGLPVRQKLAHTVKCLQDVFRRIGVRQPHIAFAKNPEIRTANDGDTGIFQHPRCKSVC